MRVSPEKIKRLRESKGWTQTDLARAAGTYPQTIQTIESGRVRRPQIIVQLAEALGVQPSDLYVDNGYEPSTRRRRSTATPEKIEKQPYNPFTDNTKVPIYGQVIGGRDGRFSFNGQELGRADAPPALRDVKDAYAVYVSGESMEPRFSAGHLVFVNPHKPATRGCNVVVQVRPEHDGEPPEGFVKEYVRQNGERLILRQFNPDQEIEISVDDVVSIHRIVGWSED